MRVFRDPKQRSLDDLKQLANEVFLLLKRFREGITFSPYCPKSCLSYYEVRLKVIKTPNRGVEK